MERKTAEAGLERPALASDLFRSKSANDSSLTVIKTSGIVQTGAKRTVGRQWRCSARSSQLSSYQKGLTNSIKQTVRWRNSGTFEDGEIACNEQTIESETFANRMLENERPSEQVRWNTNKQHLRESNLVNNLSNCHQKQATSMRTSNSHKRGLDVYNSKSHLEKEEEDKMKDNNCKQRPNKYHNTGQLSYTIEANRYFKRFTRDTNSNRNLESLFRHDDTSIKSNAEEATSRRRRRSSCKISHIQTQTTTNNKILLFSLVIITTVLVCSQLTISGGVSAYQLANNLIANNLPPKFITGTSGVGSNSEIVVRVKEGSASIGKLIYTLKGEDPDDDPLTFGVLGSLASDLLRIENVPGNQANVYLRKELDRETTESYQVVITLTDGKLGRGNWVSAGFITLMIYTDTSLIYCCLSICLLVCLFIAFVVIVVAVVAPELKQSKKQIAINLTWPLLHILQ